MSNLIVGKHRAKIGALQKPSAETIAYAQSLNLHTLGPGHLAVGEWEAAGLELPDLDVIRDYRLERVRHYLRKFDYAGIVLWDPLNIRYATDTTNMQVWVTHNATRYCFVPAEGNVVLFEFSHGEMLSDHTQNVHEIRPANSWAYLIAGDRYEEQAKAWAAEIADLVRTRCGGNMRLAIDRCGFDGMVALMAEGIEIRNGEEVMELAREIKHDEEIKAMRCAVHACEQAIGVMHRAMQPGMMEQEVWSYLHAENIKRGGEWIETRLMASGPRCNPWYQECSSRIIENGELVAFDTDLIGSYGICVDMSRTWLCGDQPATVAQKDIYTKAREQIRRNTEWLKPGLSYHDLTHKSFLYDPEEYNTYSVVYHGVGLCDEAPAIYFPEAWDQFGYDGVLQPGMVICAESYLGRKSGGPGVKLEDQVLITETGHEVLTHYPFEEALMV
ncbi:MAG: Xaa-Pro peptidase family protein [Chloroflexota bacterium]